MTQANHGVPSVVTARTGLIAAGVGGVIAVLGGLIGLGGAEFRLPVLVGLFALPARRAVSLNLLISVVTVAAALVGRGLQGALAPTWDHRLVLGTLALGGIAGARLGARLSGRWSDHTLERVIAIVLVAIAGMLGTEAALGDMVGGAVTTSPLAAAVLGMFTGVCVGAVSSLLGVAGGELLIPTLVFLFGLDIQTAGSGSLLVSLPTVLAGLWHYRRQNLLPAAAVVRRVGVPMALGSIVGAIAGAQLVGLVDTAVLKALLGSILGISAVRMWRR
jgi:uncharacterized membrane protein YfcA